MWWWILLVVVLVLAAGAWFFFKPAWAPKPDKVQADVEKNLRFAADKAGKMYEGVSGKLKLRRDKGELAKKFKEWIASASLKQQARLSDGMPAAAEGFTAWLAALSPRETEAFCDKVARFCASLGFDLAWLVDDKLNGQPELKQAVEDAVALYSIAAWRANGVQVQVRAFLAFQQWLAQPSRHRALGQKLYSELVKQGLVLTSPELYLATEKERTAEAIRAIKEVAETKPAAFNVVLYDTVSPKPVAVPAKLEPAPA
jgi:hypothetical protein